MPAASLSAAAADPSWWESPDQEPRAPRPARRRGGGRAPAAPGAVAAPCAAAPPAASAAAASAAATGAAARAPAAPGAAGNLGAAAGLGGALGAAAEHGKLLVAGALSAAVSRTAVAPLERVKMELLLVSSGAPALQTALGVLRREGLRGFWKGNALNVARLAPFKALNFAAFEFYLSALTGHLGPGAPHLRYLAGAASGITAMLLCFPLDTLRTRAMAPGGAALLARCGGPRGLLARIARREGAAALYAGALPAVIGMAPAGAIYYGVYGSLTARHLTAAGAAAAAAGGGAEGEGSKAGPAAAAAAVPTGHMLMYGAAAGVAAELLVYPLEVIRRRMQAAPAAGRAAPAAVAAALARRAAGAAAFAPALAAPALAAPALAAPAARGAALGRMAAVAAAIWRERGAAGFFTGVRPSVLQALPNAALSFYVYESVKLALSAPA
ncbi:MAG: mitochondrial carrier domain-containing protein [Monoraphidium minutum]|nr:MAG: mitochondrial carrier domain-containing protein [Monoraphidium minutum]